MTTSKSHFEQLLFKIKISLAVKIGVPLTFMCSIIKILDLKYCPVCNVSNGNIVKNLMSF